MKQRVAYIDIAKGFAMFCIIAGHFSISVVNRFVYTFHVPLFFLVSGYFLSAKLPYGQFVKQKARQLLLPYVAVGLSLIPITLVVQLFCGASVPDALSAISGIPLAVFYGTGVGIANPLPVRSIGLLWFLLALFWGLLITRAVLPLQKHGLWVPLVLTTLCAVAGYAVAQVIWLPFSLLSGMIASFFLCVGWLARQKKLFERPTSMVAVGVCLGIWIWCLAQGYNINIVNAYFGGGLWCVAGALAASYMVVLVCRWLEAHVRPIAAALNWCGQTTFPMMAFHGISDFCFPNFPLMETLGALLGIPHTAAAVCVVVLNWAWAVFGAWVSRKSKALRWLFSLRDPLPLPPRGAEEATS